MTYPYPQRIGNWWLEEKLGSGFSGAIFRAQNLHTGQVVALKLQHVDAECPTNRFERSFYPALQGGVGMPTLWGAGVEGQYDYLVIDLLGASLDSLFRKSGKDVMDLRSVCCIAMQVINRLEFMHSRGLLHRDIQLGNCVIGLGLNCTTIYMIDFGFSKFYIDPHTRRHIPDSKVKRDFIGNYWFTSVGVHCRGQVPSRRDDLEAVALMLIHLLTPGGLSWTRNGVPKTDSAHDRLIREKKNVRPEDLCRGLPSEFEEFLRYCRRLKFMDCPDYARWVEEFRQLAISRGYPDSAEFVWPAPPDPQPMVRAIAQRPTQPPSAGMLATVLNDLAKLNFDERPVLVERRELVNGVRPSKAKDKENAPARAKKSKGAGTSHDVIVISSDEENAPAPRLPKALLLTRLGYAVSHATDNATLARLVHEFARVLQSNSSRALPRGGAMVLDLLHKQLADPDVFVEPLRTRSMTSSNAGEEQPRQVKLDKLLALRCDVAKAKDNEALAKMVAEFGDVINRSNGRTITKDGFAFLEGLAARLRALS
ncbi:CK1/CK1 protein kinase [Obba rivulosa]|uniref:CK1/CK1 protein kinase n=1 Tax=Obba rivulosa TaxID=1052685 RepID=A0A8E2ALR2_9APHY|nr:CK1/CK1 protein kinase [Obba rivulosa]